MPLIARYDISPDAEIYIWHLIEGPEYFYSKIKVDEDELSHYTIPKRKAEYLIPRYMTELLGYGKAHAYKKDKYAKPYIRGLKRYVSVSHSRDMYAFMVSDSLCGVDIQYESDKILKIESKFVNVREREAIDVAVSDRASCLHFIWGAKESLYKAYGKKEVDFKKHLLVNIPNGQSTISSGRVKKNDFDQKFKLESIKLNNYTLVYAKKMD